MREQGAQFDGIELRKESEFMRGIYAKRDFKEKDEMLFVPEHLLLSYEKALQSSIGKMMKKKKMVYGHYRLNSPTIVTMAVSNMEQQLDPDHPMTPHFRVQPELDGFPVLFDDDEMSWLDGSPFKEYIEQEKADVKYDYDLICDEIPGFAEKYSLDYFVKQVYLVHSRNFIASIDDVETNVQVPLADMFNTDTPENAWWYYSDEKRGFIVEAAIDVKEGEQIYDWYGFKCNTDFFKNYGFINLDKNGENLEN
jgi:hypothetical protein